MRISSVNINPVKPSKGLIAFASIVIDNNIYLNSIAVYTKLRGSYRLLYPTKLIGDKSLDIFYPINPKTSKAIEEAIFKKCDEIFKGCDDGRYLQDSNTL